MNFLTTENPPRPIQPTQKRACLISNVTDCSNVSRRYRIVIEFYT